MNSKSFYTGLLAVTASTGLVLAALHFMVPAAQVHWKFSVGTLALFVAISLGLYYAGLNTAKSSSKLAFNNVISMSVFGKMVLSLALLVVYKSAAKPENVWFVGIFLLIYAVFTVFEVIFMTRLAKM